MALKHSLFALLLAFPLLLSSCNKDDDTGGTSPIPGPNPIPVDTVNIPGPNPNPVDTVNNPVPPPTPFDIKTLIPVGWSQNVQIPADNPMTHEGVELGRFLFYEKKLSGNNTMSCGSCHQQKFAFTDGKAVSPGIDGINGTRSTMSLTNLLWGTSFNWDGKAKTLEEQARFPIESNIELHQSLAQSVSKLQNTAEYPKLFEKAFGSKIITEANILKALAQFERTLISSNSKYDRYKARQTQLTPDEAKGMELFLTHPGQVGNTFVRGGNCGDCHGGSQFTFNKFHNNGLDEVLTDLGLGAITGKATDNGKFRAPSLRNIALTAPYMHDGRFKTLEEVLDHYSDHVKANSPNIDPQITEASNVQNGKTLMLTAAEKAQIIAFLHTLTDPDFVTNPKFSDPFDN